MVNREDAAPTEQHFIRTGKSSKELLQCFYRSNRKVNHEKDLAGAIWLV